MISDSTLFDFMMLTVIVSHGQSFTETYSPAYLPWISEQQEVEFQTVSSPAASAEDEGNAERRLTCT